MGNDLQKGTTYALGGVGGAGAVSADNLNAHVDNATIKASFISAKTLKDTASLSDSLVVESSGVLYRETHQQIVDLINAAIQSMLPVGTIVDFAGASAPAGWLFCYGQTISRTTYDDLFAVIGVTYGTGDGTTTFGLPDLRGMVVAGKDNMGGTTAGRLTSATIGGPGSTALGGYGGGESITLSVGQMPFHAHNFTDTFATLSPVAGFYAGTVPTTQYNVVTVTTPNTTAATGGGAAHINVQPTLILNKIMRVLS